MSHATASPKIRPAQRLGRLLATERGDLWVVLAYASAIGLLALGTPVAVQVLVNQITFTALLQPVVIMMVLVLLGWGLSGLLRGLQYGVVELLQQRLFVRRAAALSLKLPRAQISALENDSGAAYMNRFLEVVTLQKSSAGLLLDALGIVLQSVLGLLVLAFYHPLLLAFDVALIGSIVLIIWGLGRGGVSTSIEESRSKYAVADWLSDLATHPRLFRSAAATAYVRARTERLLHTYVNARRRHFRLVLRQMGGSLALQAIGSAALLGLGGALVMAGQLTIGQLVAAEIIVSSVVAGIAKLGKHLESYYDLMAALDKLGHLEDLPVERAGGTLSLSASQTGLALTLQGITAGYLPEHPLLLDACLQIDPGERVLVTGARGSGKSLLGDLLFGLRTPEKGLIELDGQDMRELEIQALRSHIALLRNVECFSGSLAENLQVVRSEASPSEMQAALKTVGLWEELASAPAGLGLPLTSGAWTLSVSQRRRLMVARVLLQQPRLVLVDDEFTQDLEALAPLFAPDARWTLLACARKGSDLVPLFQRHCSLAEGNFCWEPRSSAIDSSSTAERT